jgi:hypothetical protein
VQIEERIGIRRGSYPGLNPEPRKLPGVTSAAVGGVCVHPKKLEVSIS